MDKSPNKEMLDFFMECFSLGGGFLIVIGLIILKFLEAFGIIKITVGWN